MQGIKEGFSEPCRCVAVPRMELESQAERSEDKKEEKENGMRELGGSIGRVI